VAARGLTCRTERLKPVRWRRSTVQQFLRAQFGSVPFAFVLVTDDTVHVGSATVRCILEEQGVPDSVTTLLTDAYPAIADPFGRVVHGQAPADIDGSFSLTEAARPYADAMRHGHEIPVETE
jgi:hypothetical protein